MTTDGFTTPDGRLVYALIYSFEGGQQLIVPLDADGNAANGRAIAADPTKQIVEVKPGEQIRFQDKTLTVTKVETYRWLEGGRVHGWPSDAR